MSCPTPSFRKCFDRQHCCSCDWCPSATFISSCPFQTVPCRAASDYRHVVVLLLVVVASSGEGLATRHVGGAADAARLSGGAIHPNIQTSKHPNINHFDHFDPPTIPNIEPPNHPTNQVIRSSDYFEPPPDHLFMRSSNPPLIQSSNCCMNAVSYIIC